MAIDNIFLKVKATVLDELGKSALEMDVGDLVEKYAKHNHYFVHFWKKHLVEKTGGMSPEERTLYVDIAYDVFDSTKAIIYNKLKKRNKREYISMAKLKPEARFREDLKFDCDDYPMLHGALRDEYIPLGVDQFNRLENLSDCVDFVFKNRKK